MCFGGGPDVDTSYQDFQIAEAQRARAEEEARAARIQKGLEDIRVVFEGGTNSAGTAFEGTQPLLTQREDALKGFYLPQLDKKTGDARDELAFALARAGQLTSTTAAKKQGELAESSALERGSILSKIASDVAGQRTRYNQHRSSLEAGLRASGDATAATNQALQAAVTFRQEQPELEPLGNLFAGLAEGIGAAQTGYQVGQVRRAATPSPLTGGSGRLVRG